MEVIWAGIGFLLGLSLWTPLIIDARIDTKLIKLEGRLNAQPIEVAGRERHP